MQFALTGINQGKSMRLAGFRFENGLADVPDEARDAHNLLGNFYEAHPVHMLEEGEGGALVLRDVEAPQRIASVKPISGNKSGLPNAVQQLPAPNPAFDEPVDDAGGVSRGKKK